MKERNLIKISFELEQDEYGYPPDKWETLWAFEEGKGIYCVDNIPFYVHGISSGDLISAENDGDQLVFRRLVRPSSNSVFRLYVSDAEAMQGIRDNFRALGCESELSNLPKLVAVEVPASASFDPVAALLEQGEATGQWEYDEGVLRHQFTA